MIQITKKENCCGCGACAQICPRGCIEMTVDSEGFAYPSVDMQRCIHCGICERVCPALAPGKKRYPQNVFAAYALDEQVRENSSSGGIFTLLAEQILSEGGAVFGAAFADDFSVEHIMVEKTEDMYLLRGSKYLQSRMGDCYRKVKDVLEQNRPVLFSGVACQIAGIKHFLGREHDNLYTVDVLCHGVPSPLLWDKYIQEMKRGTEIKEAYFRKKTVGWKDFSVELKFKNGETYSKTLREDPFMRCFLNNSCLRPSCHNCQFREGRSGSDLTIGDAWGIQNWMPDMDDDKGTSVVLINNETGLHLLDAISGQMKYKAVDAETVISCNSVWRDSVKPHPNRARFFRAMKRGATIRELEKLSRRTFLQRMISFGKRAVRKILKILGVIKGT